MTVFEMHVALDMLCQKLNSNVYRNLLPEEKDIILNKAQMRFIREVSTPKSNSKQEGFEYTQARYDDIEELLTPLVLPCYQYTDSGNLNEAVFSLLPSNYLRLTRIRSMVYDLCGASYITTVEDENETFLYFVIPFNSITNLFTDYNIKVNSTDSGLIEVFNINDYSAYSSGLSEVEEKFLLINLILDEVNKKFIALGLPYEIFYQVYNSITELNSFIVVGTSDLVDVRYTIGEVTVIVDGTEITYNKITNDLTDMIPVTHRLSKSNDTWKLLETSFGTTIVRSPISEIENNKLISYHQKKFIIAQIMIQYIRKPRTIDVTLGNDCELDPNVHDKIVDLASRLIGSYLNLGTQKNLVMENVLKE